MVYFMRYFLILTIMLIATGCATVQKYEGYLQQWVGKKENQLISHWGVPDSSYKMDDGTKIITYKKNNDMLVGGDVVNSNCSYDWYGRQSCSAYRTPSYVVHYGCKTNFIIKDGVVQNWKHSGNSCTMYKCNI